MKTYLLSLCLFFNISLIASDVKTIIIVNKDNNDPIPFAIVTFYNIDNPVGGHYANEKGILKIQFPENINRIEFSCLGFVSKSFSLQKELSDTVKLEIGHYMLPEIVINRNKQGERGFILGYVKRNHWRSVGYFKNTEIAVYIPNSLGYKPFITNLFYKLRQTENVKNAFRIHIYKVKEDLFEPGEDLVLSNLIFYLEGKYNSHTIDFDISEFNIEFPLEGVFIGIEWIGLINNAGIKNTKKVNNYPSVLTTYKVDKKYSFYRGVFTNKLWVNKTLSSTTEENTVSNFAIGMKVKR
ncbi:MAG: hypothetical protein GZ094_21090 [Mariniphaga sp.]|nr:hypothetical protein [Mariniphaga sp.]